MQHLENCFCGHFVLCPSLRKGFSRLLVLSIFEHLDKGTYRPYDARDNQEPGQVAASSGILLASALKTRPPPSLQYMLLHLLVALLMPRIVKVRNPLSLTLLPRPIAALLSVAVRACLVAAGVWIMMRIFCPFGTMAAVATAAVKARGRTTKRASLLVQTSCWLRSSITCGAVAASGVRSDSASSPPRPPLSLMQMRVVLGALLRHREGVVGLAYGDEACGRGGIVLVVVWMVLLGQCIKLFLDLFGVRCGCDLQRFVVIQHAIGETKRCGMEETRRRRGHPPSLRTTGLTGPWRRASGRAEEEGRGDMAHSECQCQNKGRQGKWKRPWK